MNSFRDANYKLNFKKENADKTGTFRAVLISGSPGVGKTSAAHLVGEAVGYSIVEFNASDTRSKKSLDVSNWWFVCVCYLLKD